MRAQYDPSDRSAATRGAPTLAPALATAMVMVLAVALAAGGCAMGPTPSDLAHQRARDHLAAATKAIHNADFPAARRELQGARMRAPNADITAQVRSLEQLLNGAEAFNRGSVAEAKEYWQAIEDPVLAREVHRRATEIGIEMAEPRAASASEVQ
jgi:hypothetical protein